MTFIMTLGTLYKVCPMTLLNVRLLVGPTAHTHTRAHKSLSGSIALNPIWTGLFANLKRLGEGQLPPPPPNLAISNQMTMKLGKDIMGRNLYKLRNFL